MHNMTPALTARQRYWLEHIQACEDSGKSIAEFAQLTAISGNKVFVLHIPP